MGDLGLLMDGGVNVEFEMFVILLKGNVLMCGILCFVMKFLGV